MLAIRELRRRRHTPGHHNAGPESRQATELEAVLKELYPSSTDRAEVDPGLYQRFVWSGLQK